MSYMKDPQDSWELYTSRNTTSLDFKGQRVQNERLPNTQNSINKKLVEKATQQQIHVNLHEKEIFMKTLRGQKLAEPHATEKLLPELEIRVCRDGF